MDMLGHACLASLNVTLMSGYGTIMSEYALKNRDITNSSSSLLYQAAWHYENGILFFQNKAYIVRA